MNNSNIRALLRNFLEKIINFLIIIARLFFKYILFLISLLKKIKFNFSSELVLTIDALTLIIVFMFSLFVSSSFTFSDYSSGFILKNLMIYALTSVGVFMWMGTNKVSWKFFRVVDVLFLLITVTVVNAMYAPLMLMISFDEKFPNLFLIFNFIFSFIFLTLPRLLTQLFHNSKISDVIFYSKAKIPVILLGNKINVISFFEETFKKKSAFLPIFIISFNLDEVGAEVNGIPIIASLRSKKNDLSEIISEYKINNIILVSDFFDEAAFKISKTLLPFDSLTLIKIVNKM